MHINGTTFAVERIAPDLVQQLVAGKDDTRIVQQQAEQFDFIFADPPYALKELETIPELIFQNNLLKEGGLLVLEHGKDNNFEENPYFVERRVYGSVNFSIFRFTAMEPTNGQ